MENISKINILGTDYTIKHQRDTENEKLKASSGICELYTKEIILCDFDIDVNTCDNIDKYKDKVLRHEVIHAFFQESGLDISSDYARNEELVDWIAIQFPKIYRAFKELEVLE